MRNRRARPSGVNWATLSPELMELAPLRDLRRSQQLRDKRREMKSAVAAGSNPLTTASSSESGSQDGQDGIANQGAQIEQPIGGLEKGVGGLLQPVVDALCKSMSELNHETNQPVTQPNQHQNQLRV